jgi:hypothetical protein
MAARFAEAESASAPKAKRTTERAHDNGICVTPVFETLFARQSHTRRKAGPESHGSIEGAAQTAGPQARAGLFEPALFPAFFSTKEILR